MQWGASLLPLTYARKTDQVFAPLGHLCRILFSPCTCQHGPGMSSELPPPALPSRDARSWGFSRRPPATPVSSRLFY